MLSVVAGRLRNFARRGRNFFTRAGSFFTTSHPNFYHQPAEFLQPASRIFTTCHPFVFLQQHFLFLILPILILFLPRSLHTMSLSRMANHGPAKQPRDRGLIVIVTIVIEHNRIYIFCGQPPRTSRTNATTALVSLSLYICLPRSF